MNLEVLLGDTKFNMLTLEGQEGSLELTNDPLCSFRQFLQIMSGEDFDIMPEKYAKMAEHFVSSSYSAPLLMPRHNLKSSLALAENKFKNIIAEEKNYEYLAVWLEIKGFLENLKRAKIDAEALKKLISSRGDVDSRSLETFSPQSDGFARPIKYNTCGTITGRLTVGSGPHILTAHHSVRNCIQSSFDNGSIYYVDFTSMEPRVALIAVGKSAPEDVYGDILQEFPNLTRDAAKLSLLTALYGGQPAKIAELIGDLSLAKKVLSFVRAHFDVQRLEQMLSNQSDSGTVKNILGRPVREAVKNQRNRTNYFLQSSAAELSILLFSRLCSKFENGVRPLFVIHDALIVDVSPTFDSCFKETAKKMEWKGSPMPVKIELLSNN
jgi:hypothetical protein